MNISFNWLKEFVPADISAADAARKLTEVGLAVEGIHDHGADKVLDIDLTSNRPDCLSHLGVARELAAVTGSEVSLPRTTNAEPVAGEQGLVQIADTDLCKRFTAQVIEGVKIGPSPQWMVDRLEAIGERSINNVADITNYVMHELGQPMHAFDLDKLEGRRLVVRRAADGDVLTTLDGEGRKLDSTILAICDAEKPVSIAGIMGGLDSSITDDTVNVLLEVAYFERSHIRASSRKLRLATEASYHFERGVDIENVVPASRRAAQLILELAGGVPGEFVDVYPEIIEPVYVVSEDISSAVSRLTGFKVSNQDCVNILSSLGFEGPDANNSYSVPSWRHDVAIEEDLVEEVARHIGYDNLTAALPPAFGAGEYLPNELRERRMRAALTDLGLGEALSYSFVDTRHDDVFEMAPGVLDHAGDTEHFVTLQDAIIEGATRMRSSLLPGLLDSVRLNFNHNRRDVGLFEVGKVFSAGAAEDSLPNESKLLSIVITGSELNEDRALPVRELDFYDLKGVFAAALSAIGIAMDAFPCDVRHLQSGQSAALSVNGTEIGFIGKLADNVAANYKFRQPVFAGEINLGKALELAAPAVIYQPLPRFPSVTRDVSFIVADSVTFAEVTHKIRAQNVQLCRSIEFLAAYRGKGIPQGQQSVTVRLVYRSDERTLLEPEVEAAHSQIVAAVERSLGSRGSNS